MQIQETFWQMKHRNTYGVNILFYFRKLHQKTYVVHGNFNSLNAYPTKWSNTLKQFAGCCHRIVWVCFTILWGWRLKRVKGESVESNSHLKNRSQTITNFVSCINTFYSIQTFPVISIMTIDRYLLFSLSVELWLLTSH